MDQSNNPAQCPAETNVEPEKLCIICTKRHIEAAPEICSADCDSSQNSSLPSTLVACLTGENYAESHTESPQEFCKNCTTYLQEWQTLTGQISQLLQRTNSIKFTLIAYLLENQLTGCEATSSSALSWKLKQIRPLLADEFHAHVSLESCTGFLDTDTHDNMSVDEPELEEIESESSLEESSAFAGPEGDDDLGQDDKISLTDEETVAGSSPPKKIKSEMSSVALAPKKRKIKIRPSIIPKNKIKTDLPPLIYADRAVKIINGKYACSECRSRRKTADGYRQHMQKYHSELKKKTEDVIPKTLKPVEGKAGEFLYEEKYPVTLINGKLTCGCGARRTREKFIVQHIEQQHIKAGGLLSTVTQVSPTEFKYNERHSFYFNEAEGIYTCGQCDFKNATTRGILPHIRKNHYTDEDRSKFSGVQVSEREYLYGGKYRITLSDEGRYFCGICNQSKIALSDMYGHIRLHHAQEDPQHSPQEGLPAKLKEVPLETTHYGVTISYDPVTLKYKCGACGKALRNRNYMTTHVKQWHHDAPTEFICELCGESFRTKQSLSHHKARHGAPKYKCDVCGKNFKSRGTWKVHIAIHTDGDAAKRFQCEHCGKKFGQKLYLENHVRLHTGEKPFECQVCQMRFTDRGGLSYHRRTVHGFAKQRFTVD